MQLDAKEVFHVGRSPRALIMGDAFAALADDEYTLFYNPAALGKEADLRVVPFNPHLGILNPLDYIDKSCIEISDTLEKNLSFIINSSFTGMTTYLNGSVKKFNL